MSTMLISVEKVKLYTHITRENLRKKRAANAAKVVQRYIDSELRKHWWEFWLSKTPLTVEAAKDAICKDDAWWWAYSGRWDFKAEDILNVCEELEALCKMSAPVQFISITGEQAEMLDTELDP